ncbi:hypothetical protein CCGE532_31320 (plasmid) [Rhizobium sp. CCGE532]|nr:hypothetical protein CCGE532_31320 [Rhizobium sp. CCGE532]
MPAIADQYEMLRSAALGEVLPLKARSGLMLFLRRGMWGWARALRAAASPDQDPFYLSLATRPAHSAVVHVLATIAMSIHQRRAP